ncbi:MAG: hypothetical protein WA973_10805 [Mesorhizobium sp.]
MAITPAVAAVATTTVAATVVVAAVMVAAAVRAVVTRGILALIVVVVSLVVADRGIVIGRVALGIRTGDIQKDIFRCALGGYSPLCHDYSGQ